MVNKDMSLGEVLDKYTNAQEILGGFGKQKRFQCKTVSQRLRRRNAKSYGN